MGQIADTLKATLRDLAQSDARLYRGLQEELADASPTPRQPAGLLEGEDWASRADLEQLSIKVLWGLCKERGIKGLSNGPKPQQIEALLSHPDGPPLRTALPLKASKAGTGTLPASGKAGGAALAQVEQRLDRLEQLVLLIAQQVGVPPQAIAQLLAGTSSPPS